MSNTTKTPSSLDGNQTLQHSFNDVDSSITIGGFLTGKVGRKIEIVVSTTSISDDTETVTYSESGTNLYVLRLIYTDGTRDVLLSAERIS